jgi:antirestriction protein ArdC
MAANKVYEIVTDRIIEMLERGVVPWHKGWNGSGIETAAGVSFNQANYSKRGVRLYKGINQFLLAGKFRSPYWLSYKQAQELGGFVRKGEKSSMVVYWVWNFYDTLTGAKLSDERAAELVSQYGRERVRESGYPFYYNVFNVEQCDGITAPATEVREPAPVVDGKIP